MSQTTTDSPPPPQTGAECCRVDSDMLVQAQIFRDLPADILSRIAPLSEEVSDTANTLLCRQGDLATRLYVLLDGQVTLSNTVQNGISAVVEVVQPGGHFVLATMLARLPFLMNAHTTTPARLIAIDGEGILALIQDEPRIASAILRAEAMDFGAMVRQICDLKLRTTAQRLGCYLLDLSKDQVENSASFRLPFDKRLLAARLGCRQENLSRAFAALRALGVETHGAKVILHDIARLRDYAVPDDSADLAQVPL